MNSTQEPKNQAAGRFLPAAYFTAFCGGFCVMAVEIMAARLVARYIGVSLYTWTAVIGVVLAGIALGNYLGGRVADRSHPQRTLAVLFCLASLGCILSPVINRLMGNWVFLMYASWPVRVALHVLVVFIGPAVLLGMISPVVAKMALDQGFSPGRTIGNIYAWASTGSIAGTFVTGFVLIAHMGTVGVIVGVAVILALIGLGYGVAKPVSYIVPAVVLFSGFVSFGPQSWAVTAGHMLALREIPDATVIYQDESNYSFIRVVQSARDPRVRKLILDQLLHSMIRMDAPDAIENLYSYQEVYERITEQLAGSKDTISALVIGGGGYVFPRYLEGRWPGSYIEAIEIDPAVTRAAQAAFGLSPDTGIMIHHGDARNRIDDLTRENEQGATTKVFDFIYGDAFNDLAIPFQLTSYEFNEKIRSLLSDDGVYMLTLADTIESGKFLGAVINTLRRSFPYVEVYLTGETRVREDSRSVFVLVGSRTPLAGLEEGAPSLRSVRLDETVMVKLRERSRGLVLTDDYAPVENLLLPVVKQRGLRMASVTLTDRANTLVQQGNLQEAVIRYNQVLRRDPEFSRAHNNLGNALASQGRIEEAVSYYEHALRIDPEFSEAHNNMAVIRIRQGMIEEAIYHYQESLRIEPEIAETYYNLGLTYMAMGAVEQAAECFSSALKTNPNFAEAYQGLGNIFFSQGQIPEAQEYYARALSLKPGLSQAHNNLGVIYTQQGKLEQAQWHYLEVLRLKPEHAQAARNLAAVRTLMEHTAH